MALPLPGRMCCVGKPHSSQVFEAEHGEGCLDVSGCNMNSLRDGGMGQQGAQVYAAPDIHGSLDCCAQQLAVS